LRCQETCKGRHLFFVETRNCRHLTDFVEVEVYLCRCRRPRPTRCCYKNADIFLLMLK